MTPATDIPTLSGDVPVTTPEQRLVDFLNTIDVEAGTDILGSRHSYDSWAAEHGLPAGNLDEARSVRDALRSLVCGESCVLPEVSLRTVATPDGVVLAGTTAAESAVAIATVLSIQGKLSRVKVCSCDDCGVAFFDRSRNSSKTWCNMAVCGNRVKARNFREKSDGRA